MSNFSDTLKSEPIRILSKEPSQALGLVKSYLDEVLTLYKKSGSDAKPELDEIVTDGLDANQVWWQAKMVVDNVGGDLLERIYDLKSQTYDDGEEEEGDGSSLEGNDLEQESQESGSSEDESDLGSQNAGSEGEDEDENESDTGKVQEVERYDDSNKPLADVSSEEDEEKPEDKDDYEESDQESAPVSEESSNEADYSKSEKKDLNDEFFNLDEFNRQTLEAEEGNVNEQDNEEVDYFGDLPSEDDEEALYYNDFFDEPTSQKRTEKKATNEKPKKKQQEEPDFTEEDYDAAVDSAKLDLFADDDEESMGEDADAGSEKKLSTFEKQQLDIQRQIEQLEKEAVAEKKWALKGEAQSKDRPQDALLEEEVEFDRTSKPVPVITTEVTESLEDMIRRRIKEKNFDDLPRRVVTESNRRSYKPDFQLSDQKSSKSLAELYEEDYKGVSQDTAVSEELQKEHDEISDMFNNLFYKLDALSSAHFIPKPSKKSLEVRVETPAVSMEDTQPLTMSTEQSLAPQEIYRVGKGENLNEIKLKNGMPVAKEELTRDDKQRLRRAMKRRKANSHVGEQGRKKSKKDATISTLSSAKNVTVINKKGEKHDVRGNVKSTKGNENINKIKL
ncbi:hypothetical protein ZYGR_0AG04220 [Zygosaccharomyces rouxii]|uniref:U3 small nucleolar ribonucleoprotein protein MPP10 n=1 Tax=Zygosaccharomyces rouxii TaxID=4956 RepID=A0A1Q3A9X0_ZYGRO|nr:hypothetical protein ZYGR_0AG04220 [Zygosaccharomyces rouxii]